MKCTPHFVALLEFMCLLFTLSSCSEFDELFQPYWAPEHIVDEGDQIKLTLDSASGCGFESKKNYLFGLASVQIKLVQGDSAGTVTAFYMSSDGPNHDELDFEFLGNVTGEPYLVQTNVYVNGTGNREQRHSLWFDPTVDFHNYSFFWNHRYIILDYVTHTPKGLSGYLYRFLIDGIPIRVFENKEDQGVPYPKNQAMSIRVSVWNADDWATKGGRVKTNWTHAPFVSTFRSFEIDACTCLADEDDVAAKCGGNLGNFWWDKPTFVAIDRHRSRQLKWVRRRHLVYDYCTDNVRFIELPRECLL